MCWVVPAIVFEYDVRNGPRRFTPSQPKTMHALGTRFRVSILSFFAQAYASLHVDLGRNGHLEERILGDSSP